MTCCNGACTGDVRFDAIDHARGKQHLLAQDPRAGVDDDVPRTDVVARLVDLADSAVERLDAKTSQITRGSDGSVEITGLDAEGNPIERVYGQVERPAKEYGDLERFGWDERDEIVIGELESPGHPE